MSLTPEELAARRIGSSDAAIACGIKCFGKTRLHLYVEKTGTLPPRKESLQMRLGTMSESLNAYEYETATGLKLTKPEYAPGQHTYAHAQHTHMTASPDRFVVGGDRIVELKLYNDRDGWGEPGTDEVPIYILAQVTHQMIVCCAPIADVSVILCGEHRIYTVPYHAELAEMIVEREGEFWSMVQSRTPPPADYESADLVKLLNAIHSPKPGKKIIMPAHAIEDVEWYVQIGKLMSELGKQRERHQARVVEAMGEAEEALLPDGSKVKRKYMPEQHRAACVVAESVRMTVSRR